MSSLDGKISSPEHDENETNIGAEETKAEFNMPAGNMVLVANPTASVFLPFNVGDNHKGSYTYNGKTKELDIGIDGKPKVAFLDIRHLIGDGGRFFRFKFFWLLLFAKILRIHYLFRFVFNLYGAESTGEATLSVVQDIEDDDLEAMKLQRETQLQLGAEMQKVNLLQLFLRGAGENPMEKTIFAFLILIGFIVFAMLWFQNGGI